MKKAGAAALGCATFVAFAALATGQEPVTWTKLVAPDQSYSLHYPEGWSVKRDADSVRLNNVPRDEEVLIVRMPRNAALSASAYAETVGRIFTQAEASFRMTDLTSAGDSAACRITYTARGKERSGLGAVVVKRSTAWWVSYTSPSVADAQRGAVLMTAVAGSIAENAGSTAPSAAIPSNSGATNSGAATNAGQPRVGVIVGNWSTVGYYGDLVNPSTGAFEQSAYSGEWYAFNADGTYRYTIVGSGQIINGAAIEEGTYDFRGNSAVLHRKTQSWYPFPRDAARRPKYKDKPASGDSVIQIEWKGPGEIVIRAGNAMGGTFHRGPNAK